MNDRSGGLLRNAPFRFAPDNGVAFFEKLGWRVEFAESVLASAYRFNRLPWFMRLVARLPQPDLRRPGTKPWSAVVCLRST